MAFKDNKRKSSHPNIASLLRKERDQRRFSPETAFEKVFEKCLQHIKLINSHGGGLCRFTVPIILADAPLYDRQECGLYLVQRLKSVGFDTARFIPPDCIIAEW